MHTNTRKRTQNLERTLETRIHREIAKYMSQKKKIVKKLLRHRAQKKKIAKMKFAWKLKFLFAVAKQEEEASPPNTNEMFTKKKKIAAISSQNLLLA